MAHRHAFEAVDRTLRDILENETEPFGGKVFVFSGDVRQILPVVKNGSPVETIDAYLKTSTLWSPFRALRLTANMRIPRDVLIENPATDEDEDDDIRPGAIPKCMNRITDEMHADINNPEVATGEYFANRTILTTTNPIVYRINEGVA
ncbi:hypothetical protein PC113_g16412 [Phytophthora cactorum]|uniref:ATP-dependent DNA helicase n=1 Tax=Phytophthora cactorum TaxID=29920 RepID=A0A8T0YSU6_9STRA|nr:hypothetical protein PC113_g16412 [Phytophthora cactorum]